MLGLPSGAFASIAARTPPVAALYTIFAALIGILLCTTAFSAGVCLGAPLALRSRTLLDPVLTFSWLELGRLLFLDGHPLYSNLLFRDGAASALGVCPVTDLDLPDLAPTPAGLEPSPTPYQRLGLVIDLAPLLAAVAPLSLPSLFFFREEDVVYLYVQLRDPQPRQALDPFGYVSANPFGGLEDSLSVLDSYLQVYRGL